MSASILRRARKSLGNAYFRKEEYREAIGEIRSRDQDSRSPGQPREPLEYGSDMAET